MMLTNVNDRIFMGAAFSSDGSISSEKKSGLQVENYCYVISS